MSRSLSQDAKLFLSSPNGKIAAAGLFLIPLDSAWFFPLSTVYRPVWLVPFFLIGTLRIIVAGRLKKTDIALLIAAAYAILSTVIATLYFSYPDLSGVIKTITVLTIASVGTIGINHFFRSLSKIHGVMEATRLIASLLVAASIAPMTIGFIQLPGEILGYHAFNEAISSIFSYRYTPGRIHMMSGEPSWAARYILFVLVISIFTEARYVSTLRYGLLILLIFTGSALGIVTGAILIFAYFFINTHLTLKTFKNYCLVALATALAAQNYEVLLGFSPYAIDKLDKVWLLISKISVEQIMEVAATDGSVLARLMNPIIALELASAYPFGIGGESFKFWIIDQLYNYGYAGKATDEYLLSAGSTPKLLIAKIAAELGLIALAMTVVIFIRIYLLLPDRRLRYLLLSAPIFTLSDDSYLFYGLLIPVCLSAMNIQKRCLPKKATVL